MKEKQNKLKEFTHQLKEHRRPNERKTRQAERIYTPTEINRRPNERKTTQAQRI